MGSRTPWAGLGPTSFDGPNKSVDDGHKSFPSGHASCKIFHIPFDTKSISNLKKMWFISRVVCGQSLLNMLAPITAWLTLRDIRKRAETLQGIKRSRATA